MRIWGFVLRFILAMTVLFLVWIPLGPYYTVATLWPLTWLFPLFLGVTMNFNLSAAPSNLWESAFTNLVPFLALMAATPGWKAHWKRRAWQIALGILILYLLRVADRFLGYWLTKVGATDAQIAVAEPMLYFLIQLGKILFPLLLWLIFCWSEVQAWWNPAALSATPVASSLSKGISPRGKKG
ncbi:MAG: hypothetical protein NTV33_07650 [Coprothermobacterota bacterium]|nr:hypothetical protein [Coprothermobacterota bacterium]